MIMATNTDEASLAHSLLTSCYVAGYLICHRPVPVHGPGVGGKKNMGLGFGETWVQMLVSS